MDRRAEIIQQAGSGQLEVRTANPNVLAVRCTAEAETDGDPTRQFGTEIPIGAYCQIGDEQIGQEIVRSIGDSPAILIKSHGVFTIGKSPEAAVKAAVMAEDIARTVHIALLRGQAEPLPADEVARLHRVYLDHYGQQPAQ